MGASTSVIGGGPAISLRNVSVSYRDRIVFSNASLEAKRGDVIGFMGPNGAGKSTMLRVLAGLVVPRQGSGQVLGHALGEHRHVPFGIMLETPPFIEEKTGRENLVLLAKLRGVASGDIQKYCDACMRTVGLDPKLNVPVKSYSQGMRKRLALFLRAFVTRGRYVEESREEKCVLVSPESLAEQLGPFNLSERELFVLMESLRGRSLASIAKELGVSRSTAGTYRLRAYAKAGVESLDEARAKFTTPKSVQTAEVMGRGPCPVRRSVAALGLVAWFALAGSLLLPWSGSRAWLCDEVWSTLPSLLLMLASCYLIFSNQVDSRKMRRGMLRYAAVCSALIVPVSCALSGRMATTGILPVLFSSLALSALVVGFESVVNLARRAHCGIVECAAVAAMVLSVSSATAVWYTVAIATSAAILCTLLAWVVRTEKRGDETSMPEDVRTGDSKTMTQTVGFFPRREQAFCIIAGFSMVGWGFYQINEVAVLNVDAIASLPPIFFACSTLLYTSALFFIWNRYVRNREVLLASFIAIIWFASAMVIIGLQYLGCHNDASPMGHMMIGFPCMVLAGMSVDALLSFQEQHSCKSFRFAYPVVLLVGLAIWCGGIVVADAAKAFASQEISTVCIVAGGAMGFVGLVDTGRTLHKRTALSSTSSEAVIDVLIGAGLTPSEARVALLVCSGLAAREAAGVLCVECSTVRSHLRSVYAKLAVHTRAELEVAVAALVREHIR